MGGSPVSVAAAMVVSLLLLLVTARALVLPDLVEDVADAVEFRIPVANASASLQGRAVALDFAVGGHVALKARPPTALAENPAWLPDKEQIQELSPKQARQRLGFFVSAHILAWMLLCLIGTAIMTRCCGRCADSSQAATATRSLSPASRFPMDTFALGTVAATMPFLADTFDTLSTKAMTATLIALLEEEGALSLDAAVTTYLKVSCGARAHEGWDQVTLDHLMCHTGGVPGDLLKHSIWGDLWRAPDGVTGRRLFVDWLLQRPPGKLGQYEYANGGYMLLGSVVAAVTGRCWEEVGASDNRGTLDMGSQRA